MAKGLGSEPPHQHPSWRQHLGSVLGPRRRAVAALLGLSAVVGGAVGLAELTGPTTIGPVVAGPAAPPAAPLRALDPTRYGAAAEAMREKNYPRAWEAVATVETTWPDATDHRGLVLGLYSAAAGDLDGSFQSLAPAPAADARFEDWRLFLLAEAARNRGRADTAAAALDRLLENEPTSPLRPRALAKAAELAQLAGDQTKALELIALARSERVTGDPAVALESLAWTLAGADPQHPAARDAARHLLIAHPAAARDLGVTTRFGWVDGQPGWRALLSSADILARSRTFVSLSQHADALTTLAMVPFADRDLDWVLLQAQVLTALHRGSDAAALLEKAATTTAVDQARVAWARARAAADRGIAVRGRQNLPAAARLEQQRRANAYLAEVVALDADPILTTRALELRFENLADDNLFDEAIAALRQLRRLDPSDTTGAGYLWELGWQEYLRGNYSGAVGNWAVLEELYTGTSEAHRGGYWKARAFEALGDLDRAQSLYRALLTNADTSDFYRRQTLARVGDPVAAAIERSSDEPWQIDPTLWRTRALIDLGLDNLASDELSLLAGRGNTRDRQTLEAMLLAHRGERVASIVLLRKAWPALGTAAQGAVPLEVRQLYYPFAYGDILTRHADRTGLPVHLLAGIIRQESAWNPKARSNAGARGLMQLMPATGQEVAKKLGIPFTTARLFDPELSVTLGSTYFKSVLNGFDGNLELALAGYNGGPNRIRRMWQAWGQRDLDIFLENLGIEESRIYVKRVLLLSDSYRQLLATGRPAATPTA